MLEILYECNYWILKGVCGQAASNSRNCFPQTTWMYCSWFFSLESSGAACARGQMPRILSRMLCCFYQYGLSVQSFSGKKLHGQWRRTYLSAFTVATLRSQDFRAKNPEAASSLGESTTFRVYAQLICYITTDLKATVANDSGDQRRCSKTTGQAACSH